jgi:hypothetical protein
MLIDNKQKSNEIMYKKNYSSMDDMQNQWFDEEDKLERNLLDNNKQLACVHLIMHNEMLSDLIEW